MSFERADAQTTYNWVQSSGYWDKTTSWNPGGVPTSIDKAVFSGSGGNVNWNQNTGNRAVSELEFTAGIYTFQNQDTNPWSLNIGGTGTPLTLANSAQAAIKNLHLDVSTGSMSLVDSSQFELQAGPYSKLSVADDLFNSGVMTFGAQSEVAIGDANVVGYNAHGVQNILGATVTNDSGYVGYGSSASGNALVSGSDSIWNNMNSLQLGSHSSSNGQVDIDNGATVNIGSYTNASGTYGVVISGSAAPELIINGGAINNDRHAVMGVSSLHGGSATVTGSNSQWNNNQTLLIGSFGDADLSIEDGGYVSASRVTLGLFSSGSGTIMVDGSGSHLDVTAFDLIIGDSGQGDLTVSSNGLVSVAGNTHIGNNGTVNMGGGRLEFGTMSLSDFNLISGTSGSLKGMVNHNSYTNVGSLLSFTESSLSLDDVTISNVGTLYGNANINGALENQTYGEIETLAGERMRFSGSGDNSGEFNNFGGQMRFDGSVSNNASGLIAGRGQFIANGGWTNQGVMAFSGGNSDIVGDVSIEANGMIVTAGNSTTTFYDDVIHNGAEIHTADGSSTVFFGSMSGASGFTGTGTVFFEGDLRPGNSPNIVSFEGDVSIGSNASTLLEIGGKVAGLYDKLDIEGDLNLSGDLQVLMYGGHELAVNQEYLVIDVAGDRTGMFDNFVEGDLVGTYNDRELYITYFGGDGNDVALFTAVPESASLATFAVIGLVAFRRHRKRLV